MRNFVIGVGGANMDLHAQSRQAVVMRDSNPCFIHTSPGGVTRNIIENLARQGIPTALLSVVGDDAFGHSILRSCSDAGIDVSHVMIREDATSSCYFALMDEAQDMLLGVSDMRILETLTEDYLADSASMLEQADVVVCDANLPKDFLRSLVDRLEEKAKIFIDPVSTAYAKKIKPIIGRFYLVKPNLMELETLSGHRCTTDADICKASEILLEKGVRRVVVSLGGRGCYYADNQGSRMFRRLAHVEHMVNATGAGDAFMAGLVHGCYCGMPPEEFLDYALASGIIAICSEQTINPQMSDALVRSTIATYKTNQEAIAL